MTCPSLEQLAAVQTQSVSPRRMQQVQRHVAGCAACRQELARLEQTAQLLAAVPAPVMPADLWPGVAARLHGRRSAQRQWWWGTTAAAGIAAGIIVGLLTFRGQQPGVMPSTSTMTASYVANHQFLSAQDALADRASVGAALASYRSEAGE